MITRLKQAYSRILKLRGNPKEIALGFALGLFIGMTPFMGVQTPIVICLAVFFKWNKICAAFGVWITNPVSAPFIYSMTYYVGSRVLGITISQPLPKEFDLDAILLIFRTAPELFWILFVGGIVTGLPLAVAGYYFSFSAITKYREEIKQNLAKQRELRKQKRMERRARRKKRREQKKLKKKSIED